MTPRQAHVALAEWGFPRPLGLSSGAGLDGVLLRLRPCEGRVHLHVPGAQPLCEKSLSSRILEALSSAPASL